jgi:hypothetical protein
MRMQYAREAAVKGMGGRPPRPCESVRYGLGRCYAPPAGAAQDA